MNFAMTSKFLLNHKTDCSPAEIKGSFPVDFSDAKIWTPFGFIFQFKIIFLMLTKCSPVFIH